jgi:signal peptidase I
LTAAHHHEPAQRDGFLTAVKGLLEIVIAALFLVTFVVQPSRIPSESMVPTLRVGDFLLIDKQSFAPAGVLDRLLPPTHLKRGDLVVFHYPLDGSVRLVKRIVGLPGDRIRLRDGHVLLNGQPLGEPYAFYSAARRNGFRDDFPTLREADPNVDPEWWIELRRSASSGELTVPGDRYFVLGDNRNDSEDSRYWGFVRRDEIIGRPLVVYFAMSQQRAATSSRAGHLLEALRFGVRSTRVLR